MNVDDQIMLLMDTEKEIQAIYCQNCHKSLKHFPGRKQKKFCCDKCRMAWWYKKHREDFDVVEKPARGMTDRQKDYIYTRRNLGGGYQSIATELGLKTSGKGLLPLLRVDRKRLERYAADHLAKSAQGRFLFELLLVLRCKRGYGSLSLAFRTINNH